MNVPTFEHIPAFEHNVYTLSTMFLYILSMMFQYTAKKMVVLTRLLSPQLRQYPLCGYCNQKNVHTSAAYFDPMSNS